MILARWTPILPCAMELRDERVQALSSASRDDFKARVMTGDLGI